MHGRDTRYVGLEDVVGGRTFRDLVENGANTNAGGAMFAMACLEGDEGDEKKMCNLFCRDQKTTQA